MALASKGCQVILACRNTQKAEAAKAEILKHHPPAKLDCMSLDLGSLKSVRSFAAAYASRFATLDLLINNAGIMMPPFALSEDGFESQLAANYLGHFALTGLLLPTIAKTANARIVSLSSLAHKWSGIRLEDPHFNTGYDKRLAYGQSKLACLMFAYELQRRLTKAGIKTLSVAAHPGVSATNLFQHMPKIVQVLNPLTAMLFQSAQGGAQPTLYAALGNDIQGGDYCGPGSLGEMRGTPMKVGSNRRSRDEAVAAQLWALSEKMTGVHYPL
jgi:NAD(P)-dependent dehydrogenase (short-subunit alcohol dehydrogenase family)